MRGVATWCSGQVQLRFVEQGVGRPGGRGKHHEKIREKKSENGGAGEGKMSEIFRGPAEVGLAEGVLAEPPLPLSHPSLSWVRFFFLGGGRDDFGAGEGVTPSLPYPNSSAASSRNRSSFWAFCSSRLPFFLK